MDNTIIVGVIALGYLVGSIGAETYLWLQDKLRDIKEEQNREGAWHRRGLGIKEEGFGFSSCAFIGRINQEKVGK